MKSVIVKSFEFICKIGVVALILTGGAIGYGSGQAYGYGVAGAISGVCGGAILSIIRANCKTMMEIARYTLNY